MAKAAAKKADAAKKAAEATYRPLLLGVNVIYLLLRFGLTNFNLTFWNGLGVFTVLVLNFISYVGILNDAENNPNSSNKGALVGGPWLDLLGLTFVVQFCTVLLSHNFYWLLIIIPPVAGWKLYSTLKSVSPGNAFGGGGQQQQPKQSESDKKNLEEQEAKRKKRAERRRQKWS